MSKRKDRAELLEHIVVRNNRVGKEWDVDDIARLGNIQTWEVSAMIQAHKAETRKARRTANLDLVLCSAPGTFGRGSKWILATDEDQVKRGLERIESIVGREVTRTKANHQVILQLNSNTEVAVIRASVSMDRIEETVTTEVLRLEEITITEAA